MPSPPPAAASLLLASCVPARCRPSVWRCWLGASGVGGAVFLLGATSRAGAGAAVVPCGVVLFGKRGRGSCRRRPPCARLVVWCRWAPAVAQTPRLVTWRERLGLAVLVARGGCGRGWLVGGGLVTWRRRVVCVGPGMSQAGRWRVVGGLLMTWRRQSCLARVSG